MFYIVEMSGDLVATWEVSLADNVHTIEFEHGTTSGKRVIRVDGKEIKREDWMFKLVGKEYFTIGKNKTKCMIMIDAVSGFAYEYVLTVNGKSLQKFTENQDKVVQAWTLTLDNTPYRVALEKDSMEVWVNGHIVESTGQFTDEGTATHFQLGNHEACITTESTGNRKTGMVHRLLVDDVEIDSTNQ